ncbi:hypothetical protein [Thalassotalea litorea]|uniref:hypothetical protein n=1 Tax=Thalassotalea litorea TaxID=2020715 RepID=UPI003735DEC6
MYFITRICLCVIALSFSGELIAATSNSCPEESGYFFTNDRKTNPRQGGFVSNGAFVSEDAFIAPTAAVCDSATIEHNVRVMGKSVVKDEAYVSGYVRIMGNAIVGGNAEISGERSKPTIIKGYARILSGTITSGRHGSSTPPAEVTIIPKIDKLNKLLSRGLSYKNSAKFYTSSREVTFEVDQNCSLAFNLYYLKNVRSGHYKPTFVNKSEDWKNQIDLKKANWISMGLSEITGDFMIETPQGDHNQSIKINKSYDQNRNLINEKVRKGNIFGLYFSTGGEDALTASEFRTASSLMQDVAEYCGFTLRIIE